MLISLIVDFVDPPEMMGPQPTMSTDLQKALGAIEKGAQECMDALRARKEQLEAGKSTKETVPKFIGHIEKVEEEEVEEDIEEANVIPTEGDDDGKVCKMAKVVATGEKEVGEQMEEDTEDKSKKSEKDTGTKTGKKEELKKKPRSTPSAARLKEEKHQARIKEQERRWKEVTVKALGGPAGDIYLEDAMMSPDEGEKQMDKTKQDMEESDTYGKVYTKTHEKRAERSTSQAERKEQEEKKKKEEETKKAAQAEADRLAQEEAKCIIERAQLEEEELAVQKRLEHKRKQQELEEEKETQEKLTKVSATSKQQWKEQLGLKARKRRRDEDEEEYVEPDDNDKDPDYNPTKDPEQEFEEEDMYLDDEETFEIEKHVHAINLQEAGDYMVEIRRFVSCFAKVVRKAKMDVAREYRKLIHYMREMVLKIGCYGPIEHADEEAVFKTIVDLTCTAWQGAMHGAKTGNSKDLNGLKK